ncbi:MAG: MG2 domain-containing protein [Bryobacteraceae bacterium]
MRHTVWGLALLLASAPGIGQTEEEPYFALASAKTFGAGEQVSVQLNAWNVTSLDFRVYRVNDPVRFFEQLDDPHMFGGRAPRPPREQTLLERFHEFKAGWRTSMGNLLREQFSLESRHRIRAAFTRKPARTRNVASYAEAPLLNSQQLVATWHQSVKSAERWETQTVPIEVKGKGVYLVEAVHQQLRAYTIVIVSDLAMITKQMPGRMVALVVHRKSGQPVPDAEVTLWSNTNTHVSTKSWKANAQGLVDTPVAANNNSDLRLMARAGGEFAVLSLASYSIGARMDRDWNGYVYTDRPVYRPGHTVDFKAILRTQAPNGYALPKVRDIDVSIEDPDQKSVYHKRLPVSQMGAVHDSITLPLGSALGYYSIQIRPDAVKATDEGEGGEGEAYDSMTGGFQVEEYKKPEYEVRVTPVKPRVIQGESVQATIDARYYFGEPVKNAKVTWAVYRSTAWLKRYEFEGDDSGEANNNEDEDTGGEQATQNEGRLDDDGKLNITIPTDVSAHGADFRYRIEARVTDEGNREITGTGWLSATFASFYLQSEPDQYVYAPGSRARINITALDYDGNPVRTAVKAQLQEWHWGNRREVTRSAADVTTDAQGHASVEFIIPSGGSWRVEVTAPTPEKRQVEDSSYLWVSGGDAALYGEKRDTLQIVPDKKSYRPGDTAKILVVTGVPHAEVLVSVEGRTLDMVHVVDATSSSFTFEVPVRADQAPSFFVGAAFILNGQFYQGSKVVKVPPVAQTLAVAITTSKPQYKPGERAHYDIEAKDYAGRPVAAEFSLGVVDEAIYGIRKDTTPEILNFFYGRNYNVVNTDNSLSYYFRGEAGKRRMQLALLRQQQKLTQLKPDRLIQPKVRKAFPDTIFWSAEVNTGANGHAGVDFNFPDSLTTWRATARGITADTKVGAATQKTIVRKNVILRLAVPRFFTQGDEMTLSAIVHNYLTDTKAARVSLEAKGLDLIGATSQDVSIPSKGDVKVDFRVRVPAGTEAVITGKALTNEESDAMELTLPVYAQGVKLSDSRSGSLAAGGQTDFTLTFPAQVAPGSRNMEVHFSPSIAGAVFGALDYLTTFPYGCTEQTMSSFLPNIVVAKAMKDLDLKPHQDPDLLQQKITAGMDRLYDFQHEDGGWGWWKTDESQIFMTAYVITGLGQAKAAGQPIRDGVLEKATKWLREAYDKEPRLVADLKAYVNYALALEGASDAARLDAAWAERSKMSVYGTAQMGLAFDAIKDQRAREAARAVESMAKQNDSEAWWPLGEDTLMSVFVDSSPEVTAYAVKLIARVDSQSPLLPKAALWLMNHRNEGWYWVSTEQTAMVVFGLTDYLKITKELNASFTATVFVNDKQAGSKAFTAADALAPGEFVVNLRETDLNAASNRIRVQMAGSGRLYWSVREEYSSTEPKLARTGTVALNILRDYYKLSPSKSGDRVVWDLNPLQGAVTPGDILAVRLTVTGGDWRYLMIEDPIPAGTEFIAKDDLYELHQKPDWWGWWFTRRELHDNRMAIFQTYFTQGQQQYVYLLKVVNPGVFHVNPAKVQPMYQPNYFATTEARTVEAK